MDEIIINVPAPLVVKSLIDRKKKKNPLLSDEEVVKWVTFQMPVKSSKKNKSPFQMPLLSVHGVLCWALIAAFSVAATLFIVATMVLANITIPCSKSPSWWMFQCLDLTPAQDVELVSFGEWFLCFTLPQAAAATVGLLLPRHRTRSRRSLAFAALVSAAVAHYMQSRSVLIFITANPGDILFLILGGGGAILFVAGDLLSVLSLLIGASSVGFMDEDNMKLVSPPDSKKLVRDTIKKEVRFMSFLSVLLPSLWALFCACIFGGFSAYTTFGPSTSHQQSNYVLQYCSESKTCYELTSAAAALEANAILYGLLCCSVLQAATAVLALLLTGRRRCRALAYTALAATTVGHCMYGRLQCLYLAAYPEDDSNNIRLTIFILVDDLLCFLVLIKIEALRTKVSKRD